MIIETRAVVSHQTVECCPTCLAPRGHVQRSTKKPVDDMFHTLCETFAKKPQKYPPRGERAHWSATKEKQLDVFSNDISH